jgi:hypothetical protein
MKVRDLVRTVKPDVGHLVRARNRSALEHDIGTTTSAIVVDKRGIEVRVLLPVGTLSWVRRDQVEVINE